MNPRQHIAAILRQWLEMTHAESQAIQRGDWPTVRKVQQAKAELRLPLGQAVEQWRAQNPAEAAEHPFRAEVNHLLFLETQNGSFLAARKRQAAEKKKLLEQALFNLRRVRSSYVHGTHPTFNSRS
jgi:uncharacterized protein YeaC (DUF1315 family)